MIFALVIVAFAVLLFVATLAIRGRKPAPPQCKHAFEKYDTQVGPTLMHVEQCVKCGRYNGKRLHD